MRFDVVENEVEEQMIWDTYEPGNMPMTKASIMSDWTEMLNHYMPARQ